MHLYTAKGLQGFSTLTGETMAMPLIARVCNDYSKHVLRTTTAER